MAESDTTGQTMIESDTTGQTMVESDTTGQTMVESDTASQTMVESDTAGQTMVDSDTAGQTMVESDTAGQTIAESDTAGQTMVECDTTGQTMVESDTTGQTMAESDTTGQTMVESDTAGQTMVDAIYQKYDDVETVIHIHIPASAPGKKDSGHILIPPILALHDSKITSPGDLEKIELLCKKVHELDLTKNSITDWEQVIEIIDRIPRLKFLNLTTNQIVNRSSWQCEKQFKNITSLILNNTGVSWDCLVKLLHVFPSVTELYLSLNGYSSVDLPTDFRYQPLTKLHINSNKIKDWPSVCQLGQCFPNLENLVAMESELTTLISDVDLKESFPCLKSFNLSKTKLSSWEDIEVFREFPALVDVRINDVPFLKTFPEKERRQKIVARLPNITKLNGSPIYEQEREEAERAYIRQFLDEEVKPKRYYELEQIHGTLGHLIDVDLSSDPQYHMKVKFEDKEEIMDIMKNQTVKDLKKTLKNFCGLSMEKMKLYEYRSDYNDCSEIQSETRSLHSFRWTEMDEIHIYGRNFYGRPPLMPARNDPPKQLVKSFQVSKRD